MFNTWISQMARQRARESVMCMVELTADECERLQVLAARIERGDYVTDRRTPTQLRLEFLRWLVMRGKLSDSETEIGQQAPQRIRLVPFPAIAP